MTEAILDPSKRDDVRTIETLIKNALRNVLTPHGLKVTMAGGRIGAADVTLKINISAAAGNEAGEAARKAEFTAYAALYDVPPDAFGTIITLNAVRYRVGGLNLSKPKNCIRLIRVGDDRVFQCPALTLKRALRQVRT